MRYAEVAVNSPLAQPRTFSYSIPPGMSLDVGCAVWVPFGPRLLQGIVFALSDEPAVEETRDIAEVIDPHPLLEPHQIELARWVSQRYLSPLFDSAALMLPPGFERKTLTFFQPAPEPPQTALASLGQEQKQVLDLIRRRGRVEMRELKKHPGGRSLEAILGQLVRKGVVSRVRELERARVGPRTVPYLRLALSGEEAERLATELGKRRARRQASLVRALAAAGEPMPAGEATRHLGYSAAVIAALRRRGSVVVEQVRVQRDPLAQRIFPATPPLQPTPAQERALEAIEVALRDQSTAVFLLHGVTGSGKTEVYLRALATSISLGKKAIVLVPEIALTPQTIARFASKFPGRVAVLHSKLSLGEQFDEWQQIKSGAFDVVIGSRSAVFAPQPDLSLIVIDEEHEWTYKQHEQPPRYHARDVALKLAELTGSVVVLGSATPDVATYYHAQRGDYRLLELPERIVPRKAAAESRLPEVEVVDLRRELKEGNRSIFSRSLSRAIREAVDGGEQVILFLNRRGSATFVQCRDCGFVLRCRRCDIPLTYHGAENELICHHCNLRAPIPTTCPHCWSKRIRFLGLGTQRLQEETARAFPGSRLLRWDRDVTRGKYSHEEILGRFLRHEADILIGTQMIAKGLDMPLVTLVGVISADIGLHLPDFRASERTFQILAQVAGRAGRGRRAGRVIMQGYTPDHYAIAAAAGHDYPLFFQQELAFRRQQGYPPFSRLARLLYSHTNAALCYQEAERMCRLLKQQSLAWGMADTSLIGPSPAYAQRVRGKYRWQIVVRSPDPTFLLSQVTIPQGWAVDIDPVSLL